MNCKACNTRLEPANPTCPHCGHVDSSTIPPGASERSEPKPSRLSPSNLAPEGLDATVALELSDEVELNETTPLGVTDAPLEPDPPEPPAAAPRVGAPSLVPPPPSLFTLDPAQLRSLIVEQPELLEAGLLVLCDDSGCPVGAGYPTDVGRIDLLGRAPGGELVVVLVAEPGQDDTLVTGVLGRIGWVRKHLTKDGEAVRAIVLLETVSDDLGYSAAAVSGTVDFKTYRVSLTFDTVRL